MTDVEIDPASPELWPLIEDLFAAGGDAKWFSCQLRVGIIGTQS